MSHTEGSSTSPAAGNSGGAINSASSIALLLEVDKHLLSEKEAANALLAEGSHDAAAKAYGKAIEWFADLQRRAMESASAPSSTASAEAAEEVDDAASELASRVLFHFRSAHCPPAKPAGHVFSTADPLARLLVTVVDEDAFGMLTVVSSTLGLQTEATEIKEDKGQQASSSVSAAGGIGPSIALTLMALRANKAMAELRRCEWSLMPLDAALLRSSGEEVADITDGGAAPKRDHIIAAIVAAGLVGALATAIADAEAQADCCAEIARYALKLWAESPAAAAAKRKSKKDDGASGAATIENEAVKVAEGSAAANVAGADSTLASLLGTVFSQGLSLSMKAASRAARMLALLADAEELQLLAYFGTPSSHNNEASEESKAKAPRPDMVSNAAVASAKRRYQFLLKAWQRSREAAARAQSLVDEANASALMATATTTEEGDSADGGGARTTARRDDLLAPVLAALSHLKNTDEARYRRLATGVAGGAFTPNAFGPAALAGSMGRSSNDGGPLSPSVAPFVSRVHGVGLVTTAAVEDGECLVAERPIVVASGASFEDRFSGAVSSLKTLALRCRQSLDAWWAQLVAASRMAAVVEGTAEAAVIVKARDVLPLLSNSFAVAATSPTSKALPPPPPAFYLLIAVLALHSDPAKDAAAFSGGEDDEDGACLCEEDVALCSLWHNNAMQISEIDFRILSPPPFAPTTGGGGAASGALEEGPAGEAAASGLYLVASRLNHSIRRINAVCVFDQASGHLTVRALTRLEAGREIFISYAPLIASHVEQRRHLRFDGAVRELVRKPIYNTEDGEAPEGKAAVDPLLVEEGERETGEDVLAPHLFGQELIHCPKCALEIEARRSNDSVTAVRCAVCSTEIPIADYYASIEARRRAAAALCSGDGGAADRAKAVRMLFGVEDGASLLHKHHYLRSQVRMEALAAGVGAALSEELSERLVHLSRLTAERVTGLCPPAWPLATGLMMHYVYAMGRHRVGTGRAEKDNDFVGLVAREAKLDPNRTSLKFEDEAPPQFALGLIAAEPVDYCNRRILRFIFLAVQDHVVQRGAEGAVASFMERYRPELESIGVTSASALEQCLKMAAFIVCR